MPKFPAGMRPIDFGLEQQLELDMEQQTGSK